MRIIGDALVAILILARDAELTPARAGRQDHGARLQRRAVREPNLVQAALALGRDQLLGALESHDIDVIVLHMLLDLRAQLRPPGVLDRDAILDRPRTHHPPPQPLGRDSRPEPLSLPDTGRPPTPPAA